MTIHTLGVGAAITPTVVKTFFKHYYTQARKASEDKHTEASDELLFHEAFAIVRKFCEIGTHDTVESLQAFTNTHIPSPPWATVIGVLIPLSSCNAAADILIRYFGPDDLKNVVGGEKWWQVRGLAGVEAEWIAQTSDYKLGKHVEREMARERQKASAGARAPRGDGQPAAGAGAGEPDMQAAAQRARQREKARHVNRHNAHAGADRAGTWKNQTIGKIVRVVRRKDSGPAGKPRKAKRPGSSRSTSAKSSSSAQRDAAAAETQSTSHKDREALNRGDDQTPWEEVEIEEEDLSDNPFQAFEDLDRLKRVMLYCHGGAYYWGSINTHRYQIIRFARKFGGRAFAVNYRKAPNYPWPCPVQDLLAAYLYLIQPPPEAKHAPVDPAHLVLAGDSAGGGMCLALLTLLRDMELPMPAGAVLISPWCDMTHSFPSVMENTATDIVPPYGFIHKPSTLWPIAGTKPESEQGQTTGAGKDGPLVEEKGPSASPAPASGGTEDTRAPDHQKKKETHHKHHGHHHHHRKSLSTEQLDAQIPPAPKHLYSDPIEITLKDPEHIKEWGEKIVVKDQIQQYATNAQLEHPLCSPILHGSLGGLPPLYILAGNGEVLRDEIIYLAHRAARPREYPLSDEHLQRRQRSRDDQKTFDSRPTKVHLQLFDEMCHVLTVFSFTTQAKYAYRAISSFVKHVTGAPTAYIDPFPEFKDGQRLQNSPSEPGLDTTSSRSTSNLSAGAIQMTQDEQSSTADKPEQGAAPKHPGLARLDTSGAADKALNDDAKQTDSPAAITPVTPATPNRTESPRPLAIGSSGAATAENSRAATATNSRAATGANGSAATADEEKHLTPHEREQRRKAEKRRLVSLGVENEYSGMVPLLRPSFNEYMIRERVDIRGKIRPMEPESHFAALRLRPEEIGIIKEAPAVRYMTGQRIWANKFKSETKRVAKRRAKNEEKALYILRRAAERGLLRARSHGAARYSDAGKTALWTSGVRYGPTDLSDETPPPSAIAGRRDTVESLDLLRTSLRLRADAPEQSAAEKQRRKKGLGIGLWTGAMDRLYRSKVHVDPTTSVITSARKSGERRREKEEQTETAQA